MNVDDDDQFIINALKQLDQSTVISIFKPCMIEYILKPRFKLSVMMDELLKFITKTVSFVNREEKEKYDRKLENAKKLIDEYIFRVRYEPEFPKLRDELQERFIPLEIARIVQDKLGINVDDHFEQFYTEFLITSADILNDRVEQKIDEYFLIRPKLGKDGRSYITTIVKKQPKKDIDPEDIHTGKNHFITVFDTDTREGKRLERVQKIINVQGLDKQDTSRLLTPSKEMFMKLIAELKLAKFGEVSMMVEQSEEIWKEMQAYATKNGVQTKIKGSDISAVSSKLILHGYVLAIQGLIPLHKLEGAIQRVSSPVSIKSSYILDSRKLVPNKDVQNIIDRLLPHAAPELLTNWRILKYPTIHARVLIKELEKTEPVEIYRLKTILNDIEKRQPQTGSTTDWFFKMFQDALKAQKIRLNRKLPKEQMVALLRYNRPGTRVHVKPVHIKPGVKKVIEDKQESTKESATIIEQPPSTVNKGLVSFQYADDDDDDDDDF